MQKKHAQHVANPAEHVANRTAQVKKITKTPVFPFEIRANRAKKNGFCKHLTFMSLQSQCKLHGQSFFSNVNHTDKVLRIRIAHINKNMYFCGKVCDFPNMAGITFAFIKEKTAVEPMKR